jgi:hypothetical protein
MWPCLQIFIDYPSLGKTVTKGSSILLVRHS